MRRNLSLVITISFFVILASCSGSKSPEPANADSTVVAGPITVSAETDLLLKDLVSAGDYVNSREFPSLIKASVVYESLGNKILVIDLRSPSLYAQGHIQGAVNKKFEELPSYFEKGIKPFEYDKIVLACDDGQISSYTASLLRLMGYGNVYALRWGMSSWNRSLAENDWLKGLSASHEPEIELAENAKPVAAGLPELGTGLSSGEEIAAARFKSIFSEGTKQVLISSDEVFSDPGKYFVINYERKDKYDDGHIPGAVRYKPNATLGIVEEMATIPVNKTVVIYCGTGHNSGFVTAYLRLFGYDARTLKYGNNGFMHDKMVKDAAGLSWLPFSDTDINEYPLVK